MLETLVIPRWTENGPHTIQRELHGFSDASTQAYAACVCLRIIDFDGSTKVNLLISKSKVAPIKTISIRRLELLAAQLLARLMSFVKSSLGWETIPCFCWTDSTVTIAWISQSSAYWKTFVANRVADIQSLVPDERWNHVAGTHNPADPASRGISSESILSNDVWWHGPSWLRLDSANWPEPVAQCPIETPEMKIPILTIQSREQWDLAIRFSPWLKLLRVTAYIYRFIRKFRRFAGLKASNADTENALPGNSILEPANPNDLTLQPADTSNAKLFWLKTMQMELFEEEISCMKNQIKLPRKSPLTSLNPFLDQDGLLRARGRLRESNLSELTKQPIILRSHPLLKLIIKHVHVKSLHAGSQLTLSLLRQEFWILRARPTVRAVLYKCLICTREKAAVASELMRDLPRFGVTPSSRPFVHSGVDYAGPIQIRLASGRGHKSSKAYIALFVCMTTKAIHLELVTDYTSRAFLAAFSRFCARRGLPTSMYSDNGTTFQGADRELTQSFQASIRNTEFRNQLVNDQVSWHFSPPTAPHFGGLWEAGVKSVKFHSNRVIGSYKLTFEEMSTLLCRIEACLNSRPLAASSDNFDDYQALTPGHFLIGAPLKSVPEPTVSDLKESRLSRWQFIQRATEDFWKSWSSTYLHTLQQRPKWREVQNLAQSGRLVLLRSALLPPCQWELGRITECHPGEDGLTRVVTVKTASSVFKRPIVKLCFLPIDINPRQEDDLLMAGGASP